MNVVIANKYKENIKTLGIEIVGRLEGTYSADDIIQAFNNFYFEKLILDVTSINNYNDPNNLIINLKKLFTFFDSNKTILLLDNIPVLNNSMFLSKIVELNACSFTFDVNEVASLLIKPKTIEEVREYKEVIEAVKEKITFNNHTRVIGVKNVTEVAGSTTLIYIMYQELIKKYSVRCLELDRNDFKYFYNEDLKSISNMQLTDELLIEPFVDVILIDMNNYDNDLLIKEVLYLIEPSVLKLNKLIDKKPNILNELQNKKVVLNKTNITLEKAKQFEKESKIKVFDMIRMINERDTINPQVINLLIKLGFNKINNGNIMPDDTEKKKALF